MPPQPVPADQAVLSRWLLDAMGLTEAVLTGTPYSH